MPVLVAGYGYLGDGTPPTEWDADGIVMSAPEIGEWIRAQSGEPRARRCSCIVPAPSTTMPRNPMNRAAASGPSTKPCVPATPAIVLTTPPVEMRRTVEFPESAT